MRKDADCVCSGHKSCFIMAAGDNSLARRAKVGTLLAIHWPDPAAGVRGATIGRHRILHPSKTPDTRYGSCFRIRIQNPADLLSS